MSFPTDERPSYRSGSSFKASPIKKSENPFNPSNFNERKFGRVDQPWGKAWQTSSSQYGRFTPHQQPYNFSTLDDRPLSFQQRRNILRDSVWDAPPRTESGMPMTPQQVLRYRGIVPHEKTADYELMRLPEAAPVTRQPALPVDVDFQRTSKKVFMQRHERPVAYNNIRHELRQEHLKAPSNRNGSFSYETMGNPTAPLFSRLHPRQ